jgi:hypothetical protein
MILILLIKHFFHAHGKISDEDGMRQQSMTRRSSEYQTIILITFVVTCRQGCDNIIGSAKGRWHHQQQIVWSIVVNVHSDVSMAVTVKNSCKERICLCGCQTSKM